MIGINGHMAVAQGRHGDHHLVAARLSYAKLLTDLELHVVREPSSLHGRYQLSTFLTICLGSRNRDRLLLTGIHPYDGLLESGDNLLFADSELKGVPTLG